MYRQVPYEKLRYKTLAASPYNAEMAIPFSHCKRHKMSDESFDYRVEFKEFHHWSGGCPTQTLVFHHNGSSWWIRVQADWPLPEKMLWFIQSQCQSTFQTFVEALDLAQLPLLDNTVTYLELRLTGEGGIPIAIRDGYHTETNYFIEIAHELVCTVGEDPKSHLSDPT